jgi:hypothetical protein
MFNDLVASQPALRRHQHDSLLGKLNVVVGNTNSRTCSTRFAS